MAATALRGRPWDAYAASPFRINMRPSCHVNRIKMIKRQMYGRAGFSLQRKRILLPS
ncbi:hypothetical protein ABZ070_33250 [Streptomyces sp. NPDC006283]|uniref:hypothetical protein n=1 Tax=Streptomyces sp. NPDC006283 TaxID=3156741 RepID=UPI0033B9A68A